MNLGPFQPVEVIKILLVFFLAGYFTRNWERLRDLREKRLVPRSLRWIGLPRLSHVLPVMCAVALALGFFFLLKDLGPALVTGFLFLAMFAVARGRAGLAVLGIVLLVGGVAVGYRLGKPRRWWIASTCGCRLGTTTFTAAINWRIRCGRFLPAARWDRDPDGAIRK